MSSSSLSDFDMDPGDVNEGVEVRVQASVQQSIKKAQDFDDLPEFEVDEENMGSWEDDSQAPTTCKPLPRAKSYSKYYYLFEDPPKKKIKVDVQRFYQYQEKVNEKIRGLSKAVEEKEVKECTFRPVILTKNKPAALPEFLKRMAGYDQARKQKIRLKMNEREEEELKAVKHNTPKLCENSLKIAAKKDDNGIKRLIRPKLRSSGSADLSSFKPAVNQRSREMIREKPIDQLLYEDALRRYSKTIVDQPTISEKSVSAKSDQVLFEKFKKEYEDAFLNLAGDKSSYLNYTKFIILLEALRFLSRFSSALNKSKQLAIEIWSLIGGDTSGSVSFNNLLTILVCIMNYKDPSRPSHKSEPRLGRMIKNVYCVSPEEVLRVHQHFLLLFEQRSSKLESLNSSFRTSSMIEVRKKADTKHEEMLINEKHRTNDRLESARQQKITDEMAKCTFKPKIHRGPRTLASSSDMNESAASQYSCYSEVQSPSLNRGEVLYEYSKIFTQQKHRYTKSQTDLGSGEDAKSCTFRPNLNKRIVVEDVPEAKGVKELINRLRNARKNKMSSDSDKPFVFSSDRKTERLSVDFSSSGKKVAGGRRSLSLEGGKTGVQGSLSSSKGSGSQTGKGHDKQVRKLAEKNVIKQKAEMRPKNQPKRP